MKNMIENFAITLIGLLSLGIVYLIVQYNMIEENSIDDMSKVIDANKKENAKIKTSNYLNSLESYGDDADVKTDAKKEDHTNEVKVESELNKDKLDDVVEDKSKSSYMENLEHYAEETDNQSAKTVTPQIEEEETTQASPSSSEPEKLPQEEVSDEIGEAISAALDDL
jgi:hypothetical protein